MVWVTMLAALTSATICASAAPTIISDNADASDSLRHEARAAIDRGHQWLLRQQDASGAWSSAEFPALTALPVWALSMGGKRDSDAVTRGVAFILSCTHDDGSIFRDPTEERRGGGLRTYNTALSMVALRATGNEALDATIERARRFLARSQHRGDDEYRGGMGYDAESDRTYADLSNSYVAYEAMRLTRELADLESDPEAPDLDWSAARDFLAAVQNHDGGFIYRPGQSMAGSETNAAGVARLRSYGSMTYAGLLSLIYADVDPGDERVRSAFDWAANHWTLDENPGMGSEGLYYFYHVLAKALAAYGRDVIPTPAPGPVNWRDALIRKLVGLQRIDPRTGEGYWVNDQGRWWENDPVLVTSYALLALEIAVGENEDGDR